nr:hypothetical protein [Tanacetum cinerariifolium]
MEIPNIVVENQKEEKRIIKDEEDNMIAANKKKRWRSVVVIEKEDVFETRKWSSRSKARPNYADDPFKHIVFDRKINPNKKPKKNPSSSAKKDTPKTSTDDGPSCPKKDTPSTNDVKQPSTSKVVRDGASTMPRYAAKHQVPDENGNLVYVESVSKMTHEMFAECCPVCQDNCNYKGCLRDVLPKVKEKVNFEPSADKEIQYSIYILHVLLPFLESLNAEHIKEKQIEGKIQGTFFIGL